jgi:L-ascorbate metabolism protein UlaG (beta-lactamase superfamily)
MASLGIVDAKQTIRMNKSGTVMPLGPDIRLTQVRAEHSSELAWTDPITNKGAVYYGGLPIGWIVRLENGFTIYHMGDTGLFSDMSLIGDYYKPDLILVPIGGHFTMGPEEAAYATKNLLKPKHVLPFHYGTFPPLKGTPEEYVKALGRTSTKVHAISPGETIVF